MLRSSPLRAIAVTGRLAGRLCVAVRAVAGSGACGERARGANMGVEGCGVCGVLRGGEVVVCGAMPWWTQHMPQCRPMSVRPPLVVASASGYHPSEIASRWTMPGTARCSVAFLLWATTLRCRGRWCPLLLAAAVISRGRRTACKGCSSFGRLLPLRPRAVFDVRPEAAPWCGMSLPHAVLSETDPRP
jgi:hypothetical protein